MTKILLDGSGGSTKGVGIYNAWKTIFDSGVKPNYISGVSVSCLLSVPFALGKFKELENILDNFCLKTIFKNPPINEKGKLSFLSILNVIRKKSGLAKMNSLEKLLRKLVTKQDFENYKTNKKYPTCIGMAVNFQDGSRFFFDCKKINYEQYINYTIASCSIPVYSEPVFFEGKTLLDGGVRNHSIAFDLVKELNVTHVFSVFSRPETAKLEGFKANGVLSVLSQTLEIMQNEISKQSENWLKENCKDLKINLKMIFLPQVLNSLYDVDRTRLNELKQKSIQETKKVINEREF